MDSKSKKIYYVDIDNGVYSNFIGWSKEYKFNFLIPNEDDFYEWLEDETHTLQNEEANNYLISFTHEKLEQFIEKLQKLLNS